MKNNDLEERIQVYAKTLGTELVGIRRSLHQIPELSDDLPETRAYILKHLEKFKDIVVKDYVGNGGITALLEGGFPGKTIGYRADMDALPVEEVNDISYKSIHPGKMHACGHDSHVTIALGILAILYKFRKELKGNVKFIFQPAEETCGGALEMIKDGALLEPVVDEIYGGHVWPSIDKGKFGLKPGPLMAGTDYFWIDIEGKGGHPGIPHHAVNPIVVGSKIVSELESITSYFVDSNENAVISVCSFHGGFTRNIIPSDASIIGTVRTFSAETQGIIIEEMDKIAQHIGGIYSAKCNFKYLKHFPPTINCPESIEKIKGFMKEKGMEESIYNEEKASMGAEDFSYFLKEKPGAFIFIGTRNEEKGIVNELHHPRFNIDEDIILETATFFSRFFLSIIS